MKRVTFLFALALAFVFLVGVAGQFGFALALAFVFLVGSTSHAPPRPLEYAALVNQSSVAAPSADVVYVNSTEATFTFARIAPGDYRITASPCVFPDGKVIAFASPNYESIEGFGLPPLVAISHMNPCEVWYQIAKEKDGVFVFSDFSSINISIRIYP